VGLCEEEAAVEHRHVRGDDDVGARDRAPLGRDRATVTFGEPGCRGVGERMAAVTGDRFHQREQERARVELRLVAESNGSSHGEGEISLRGE
jgi:hypothetical protein